MSTTTSGISVGVVVLPIHVNIYLYLILNILKYVSEVFACRSENGCEKIFFVYFLS
jgi:hypothetical protein